MNIVFMGTPEFAVPSLESLIKSKHTIIAVFTKPDTKQGRGQKLQISPIKDLALKHNIQVFQPKTLKNNAHLEIVQNADVVCVAAYGLILPQQYLDAPKKYGCINIHASILPKYRGAAPIQRSIANQDKYTGISLMQMDAGLDTGDVFCTATCDISPLDNTITLSNKLAKLAVTPLLNLLENPQQFTVKPQDNSQATYAHKIKKAEAKIDWQLSAQTILAKFKALQPWPGIEFIYNNITIKVKDLEVIIVNPSHPPGRIIEASSKQLVIAAKENAVKINVLQLPNKSACKWEDFYRGQSNFFED